VSLEIQHGNNHPVIRRYAKQKLGKASLK